MCHNRTCDPDRDHPHRGTDAETFVFRNGSPGAYTRYAAYMSERVVIRPALVSPFTVWFPRDSAYIELSGLTIDGENSTYELRTDGAYSIRNPLTTDNYAHGHHIRIVNNEIMHSGLGEDTGDPGSCVLLAGDNEFIGNHVHDCGSYGVYAYFDKGLIEGNNIHDTGRYAIHLAASEHPAPNFWTIRNNKLYRAGSGTHKPGGGEPLTSAAFVIDYGHNNNFYNNLIYDCSHGGVFVRGLAKNNLIANNTIYGNHEYGIKVGPAGVNTPKDNLITNNIVWKNDSQIVDSGTNTTLKANFLSDPNVVDLPARNFRLRESSPAVDMGVALTEVPTSFDGTARPQGRGYDIGAYEFRSGQTSSTPNRPVDLKVE